MDIDNGYYLAKFQNLTDLEKVLSQGPWIVYEQYLTVQPWSIEFSPLQLYPDMVIKILWEIGGIIGRVAKLDFNTNNGVRDRFTRMAAYVNLGKALISQILINGVLQKIEYEYLPTVCFSCGHYGYNQEICPNLVKDQRRTTEDITGEKMIQENRPEQRESTVITNSNAYGPWMLVERRN
ncbi:hypothetical protein J1N35_007360 [Gossypium stocksii]|uniref:DUF4283 domain-containing protein n=1 Tax=Gossypium stocksii TaxID=47602 RepID=A0A9D4ADE6_9ROSI|nr:hypothetical protein J1N35_007360 [Gossypium stocksii]